RAKSRAQVGHPASRSRFGGRSKEGRERKHKKTAAGFLRRRFLWWLPFLAKPTRERGERASIERVFSMRALGARAALDAIRGSATIACSNRPKAKNATKKF